MSNLSKKKIFSYLDQDYAKRPIAFFDETLINISDYSSYDLDKIQEMSTLKEAYETNLLNNFLIDLSWKSSEMEGNSYTLLDSKTLLEYGQKVKDKPDDDAKMIINHKNAIQNLSKTKWPLSDDEWKNSLIKTNSLLLENLDKENRGGLLRRYGELIITHSSYIPSSNGLLLDKMLIKINNVILNQSPIIQSFHLFSRLPYLQLFFDGNKRTSRLLCNLPLLSNNLIPLSMIDIDKGEYIKAMIAFYELGDDSYLKDVFLLSYMSSILRYKPWTSEQKITLNDKFDKICKQMLNYIKGKGTCPKLFIKKNNTDDGLSL